MFVRVCVIEVVLEVLYIQTSTVSTRAFQVQFKHTNFNQSFDTLTYTHISSTNYQHTHSKIPTKKNSKLFISKTKLKQNHLVTGTGCAHGIQNQPVFAEGSCAAISNRCKTIEERKRRNQNLQNFDLTDERAPNKVQF